MATNMEFIYGESLISGTSMRKVAQHGRVGETGRAEIEVLQWYALLVLNVSGASGVTPFTLASVLVTVNAAITVEAADLIGEALVHGLLATEQRGPTGRKVYQITTEGSRVANWEKRHKLQPR